MVNFLMHGRDSWTFWGWGERLGFFSPHHDIRSRGVRNPGKIRATRGCGWIPPGFTWRHISRGVTTVDSGFRETCHLLAVWPSPDSVTSDLRFLIYKIEMVVPASFSFCCVFFFLNRSQSFPIFFHLLLLLITCPPEDNINSMVVEPLFDSLTAMLPIPHMVKTEEN